MTQDPYRYFRIEAAELLERIGQALLDLDRGTAPGERMPALLRQLHTLKGAARVVKLSVIADAAHRMEDELAPYRNEGTVLSRDVIDRLLAQADEIGRHVKALDQAAAATTSPQTRIVEPTPATISIGRQDTSEVDALLEHIDGAVATLATTTPVFSDLSALRARIELLVRQIAAPSRDVQRPVGAELHGQARRIEELSRAIEDAFRDRVDQMERDLAEIRTAAEAMRLIPARRLVSALERAARDTARSLGKDVVLQSTGSDVRLDGDVLLAVQEALVQVVTNAVVHGVETPAERTRAGKPAIGTILLDVKRIGGRVVFTCQDDGRGLDVDGVRHALHDKGIHAPSADDVAQMLALLPGTGVSTATQVTHSAGRGVGLDVVRDVATRLGGTLRIHTDRGLGFRVELDVPLSVASFDALGVEAVGVPALLAMESILRCERLGERAVTQTDDGYAIAFQGRMIPYVPLAALWTSDRAQHERSRAVLVLATNSDPIAVGVERLRGSRPATMRPLPPGAVSSPAIAGASLDSLGNPVVVLDANGMAQLVRVYRPGRHATSRAVHRVLVIDDSLTTRMMEQSILESAGYHVDLAVSAEDALARLERESYHLFLVDVEMPGMDGFSFVAQTRADPRLRHIPAVLVSSRSHPEDLARGTAVGASGYMIKSRFDQRELLSLIERLITA